MGGVSSSPVVSEPVQRRSRRPSVACDQSGSVRSCDLCSDPCRHRATFESGSTIEDPEAPPSNTRTNELKFHHDNRRTRQDAGGAVAEKYGEQKLVDAFLRLRAGHTVEEVRTFYPMTAGVLQDAWGDLQDEFDIEPVPAPEQDVHARSLKYANPIDPTLAIVLKGLHRPKLEDSSYHPAATTPRRF